METRANHVLVGAVTLLLLAALAAFIIWIARLGQGKQNEYDIFFKQSVSGLAKGSQVSFAGVPVGQINTIELWPKDPEFVRVRIKIDDDVPILVGTTATIQGSFTGVSTIQLDGARRGASPITCESKKDPACPEGVPVIPTKAGGLGALLNSAPLLLERLATLTDKLNQVLSDKNQNQIAGILRNTNEMTRTFAQTAPQIRSTLAELERTLAEAGQALDGFEKVMGSTDRLVNQDGVALAAELRKTLKSANEAATSLSQTLDDTRPAARQLSETTLPQAEATLEELRSTSSALRKLTESIEDGGAGSLIKGKQVPEYKP